MRLIDADEYKEKLYAMMPEFDEENDKKCIEGQTIFFCIAALNDMPTIAPLPNAPLTLDELREMDGEPVWVESINGPSGWCLVARDGPYNMMVTFYNEWCGKTWLAYRRKPEEVTP